MSRTRRRVRYWWIASDQYSEETNSQWWDSYGWWTELCLSFQRGHRPGNEARTPGREGGWWTYTDIPGRNCANHKRWCKRRTSKMRRREAKKELRNYPVDPRG